MHFGIALSEKAKMIFGGSIIKEPTWLGMGTETRYLIGLGAKL